MGKRMNSRDLRHTSRKATKEGKLIQSLKHPLAIVVCIGTTLMWSASDYAQPVTGIAAGAHHSLFIKGDGSLWAMGEDNFGQLGDGNITYSGVTQPELITNNVTSAAGGNIHSLFIRGGNLWGMGYDG